MSERSEPHSKSDGSVREHVVSLLSGHGAHLPFERAIAEVPEHLRGIVPESAGSSLWQQLEHLRIAQWDILEFSRDAGHESPEFPDGYWPATVTPPAGAWQRSIDAFLADRDAMAALIRDPAADLYRRIPHGTGQTLLREALVLADHNAYHVEQIVLLRRLLGCW